MAKYFNNHFALNSNVSFLSLLLPAKSYNLWSPHLTIWPTLITIFQSLGSPFTNCTKDRATHSSLSERNILNWSLLPEEKIQKQFSYFFLRVKYRSSQQTARHPARVGSGRPSPCEISLFSLSTPALKYCSALDMMVTFVVSLVTCNDKLIY